MLGTILFLIFWVVLAFVLFFLAIRGRGGAARAPLWRDTWRGRRVLWIICVIVYVGVGVAVPLAVLTGDHANASNQVGGIRLNAAEKRGRQLFGQNCGVCHTLAAANAVGKVGPNLDMLKPPQQLVLNTVKNGCVSNPPQGSQQACLGQGTMPAQLLSGKDAQNVSQFVAAVAGKE